MNMSFEKNALRIISVFNCITGGIILFLMLMTYAIGLFAVIGTWNLLEPDELIEVLEIGGCSLVLVVPGILMLGEGILSWMAVKDPSRITGACSIFARPMFTMSFSLRLISAGEPAPSITMMSFSLARERYVSRIIGIRLFL